MKSLFTVKGADIVECEHCSMIYAPTPAPEFSAMYRDPYYSHIGVESDYSNYRSEFSSHLINFTRRMKDCEKIVGKVGRVLDVGCALGHLGEAARRLGWDVYVTDVSEYAVLETRKHFELNGFVSSPVKLPVKAERFDLITLYDVVENLSHPLDLLKDIRKALHTDGVLHIVTPNSQSISAKIMGRKWSHLKPSEHFLYFTPETLRSALERVGFDVLKIKNISNYIRVNDLLLKFEKLSKPLVSGLRKFAKFLGIADMRIKIYTGQMQVWARPVNLGRSSKFVPVKDILDIVCCSHCKSELQLFEDSEAICTECELSFDVSHGVINFSKYGKRYKQKVV